MLAASSNMTTPLPGQGGNPAIASAGTIAGSPRACKGALKKILSFFFLRDRLFSLLPEKKKLKLARYNKSIQERIDININHYKAYCEEYSSIELDIIPMMGEYGEFINIKEKDKKYFHIYFNDNKSKEIENTYLHKDDNVSKISITIDHQIKSFKGLFSYCGCIESIEFKKFCRNNITDMSNMFYECASLKELNLNNFNTNNVTDMCGMFSGCYSLKELNLNNFNTNNVTDMNCMFEGCASLKKLNLSNFNTNNATDMYGMFNGCSNELKLKIKNNNYLLFNKYLKFKKNDKW